MTRPATGSGRAAADDVADAGERPAQSSPRAAKDTRTTEDTQEFSRPELGADPEQTVVMPAEPGFEVSWRGYDRQQVDSYRSRIEGELAAARLAHERVLHAHAQIAERLHAAEAQLARLRAEMTNSPTALSERLREILQLAAEDADQTRSDARTEADRIRAVAQADADQLGSQARADAEAMVAQAREAAVAMVEEGRTEQAQLQAALMDTRAAGQREREEVKAELTRLREASHADLERLANEARQARERADAEAEARRGEAERRASEERELEHAAAVARLDEMSRQVTELTRHRDDLRATLNRLHQALGDTLATTTGPENGASDEQAQRADAPAPRSREGNAGARIS